MPEYDQYLDEYVYSKIWAELSSKDKEILSVISESGYQSVKDIREKLDMKPELFPEFPRRNTIFFFEFSIKVRYIIKTTIRSHYNNRLGCGF